MSSRYKTLIKDFFIFGLGSIGSKLILFLLVPLYTNYMTDAEYGISDLVFTTAQLVAPFLSVVIFDAVTRFGLSKSEKKEDVLLVGFAVLGFAIVAGAAVTPLVGLYKTLNPWKWYLYVYIIFNISGSIEFNYLKVKDKNKIYALFSILRTGLMAGLNIYFLVFRKMGIQGYLLAYISANAIIDIAVFFVAGIGKDLRLAHFDKQLFIRMLKFSSPLILNNISWWIIHSSDKYMVEIMISAAALGIYTVAAKIPSLINVIVTIFQQAWGISSIKEIESTNDTGYYSAVFRYFFLLTSGACIFLTSIMKIFMHYYVGKEFFEAWQYIPLLLVSAVFTSVSTYFGSMYGALKKPVNSMITTVISALINIIVNFILIPRVGIWGAVIGTVASYIFVAVSRMIDVCRYIKIKIDYFKFISISIIIIAQAVLVSLDRHIYIVSLIALILYFIINFNDFIYLLKRRGKLAKN